MTDTPTGAAGTRLADRYRVLLDISRILTRTLSPDDLYRVIYRQTARILEAPGFYISLYDSDRDLATVVFYADEGRERRVEITYRGSESRVIREGRAFRVDDRDQAPSVLVLGGDGSPVTRSALSAPLRHHEEGEVMGAVSVQSYEAGAYADVDLELLQGIADIAAVALDNALHVEELRRERQEAETLESIGRALTSSLETRDVVGRVIEAVLTLLEADGASVWLLDGTVARVAASGGRIGIPQGAEWDLEGPLYDSLVGDREPVLVDDLAGSLLVPDHLREVLQGGTGLGVPLLVEGEVAGVLTAGSARVGDFGPDGQRILARLADQASVALANARLHQQLRDLSLTDPLTGLPNRRQLDVVLQREVAAASRGREVVAIIFDLDNFKGYNDSLGHLAGDEALRAFGSILKRENRAMNLVARYGGDEFITVLPDTDEEGARTYVHRVTERVARDELLAPGGISVSWGMASFDPRRMGGAGDLLRAADRDLYRRKPSRARVAGG